MKKVALVVLCALCVSLTACNTVKGFGQDVQKGGQKLENVASK